MVMAMAMALVMEQFITLEWPPEIVRIFLIAIIKIKIIHFVLFLYMFLLINITTTFKISKRFVRSFRIERINSSSLSFLIFASFWVFSLQPLLYYQSPTSVLFVFSHVCSPSLSLTYYYWPAHRHVSNY